MNLDWISVWKQYSSYTASIDDTARRCWSPAVRWLIYQLMTSLVTGRPLSGSTVWCTVRVWRNKLPPTAGLFVCVVRFCRFMLLCYCMLSYNRRSRKPILCVLFIELHSLDAVDDGVPYIPRLWFAKRKKFHSKSCSLRWNVLHPSQSSLVRHHTFVNADVTLEDIRMLEVVEQHLVYIPYFFSYAAGWVAASKSSLFAKCKNFIIKLKRYSLMILRIIGVLSRRLFDQYQCCCGFCIMACSTKIPMKSQTSSLVTGSHCRVRDSFHWGVRVISA